MRKDTGATLCAGTSSDGVAAVKKNKTGGKPTRKKAAKKSAKTSAVSGDNGSDSAEAAKVDAKKPARGRKPKAKSQTNAIGAPSDGAGSVTAAKKPAQKSSVKKAKKLAATERSAKKTTEK